MLTCSYCSNFIGKKPRGRESNIVKKTKAPILAQKQGLQDSVDM